MLHATAPGSESSATSQFLNDSAGEDWPGQTGEKLQYHGHVQLSGSSCYRCKAGILPEVPQSGRRAHGQTEQWKEGMDMKYGA